MLWFPCSTISPLSITKILSACLIVDNRWAITILVLPFNKYKIDNLKDEPSKQNYNDARRLIYRYYHKDIAINYSYIREATNINVICKEKIYMDAQIELINSCQEKDFSQFETVFNGKTQFTDLINNITANIDKTNLIDNIKTNKQGNSAANRFYK